MTRIRLCAMLRAHKFGGPVYLSAARTLGVGIAALLMCAMFSVLLWSPTQVYARSFFVETAQAVPVVQETESSVPEDSEPELAPVQIDLSAVISDSLIAYTVYATNVTERSVWDLTIRIPLPPGTMLLSAQSSYGFVTDYEDAVVSFYVSELRPNVVSGPQRVLVRIVDPGDSFITTAATASWKYLDSVMRQSSLFQQEAQTSPISVYPGMRRQVVADIVNDVPLPQVDLTSITIQPEGSVFRIDFNVAGPLGPPGEPAEYIMYLDADCNGSTGRSRDGMGVEYRVRYRHEREQADLDIWTQAADGSGQWLAGGAIAVNSPLGSHAITLWIPSILLNSISEFCWMAETQHRVAADAPKLPKDNLPNGRVDLSFTQYGDWDELQSMSDNLPIAAAAAAGDAVGATQPAAESSPPALSAPISQPSGKLAIPLGNASGAYDVHIISVTDGQLLQQIADAYQPAFASDGTSLLVTQESGSGAAIYQYQFGEGAGVQSSEMSISSYASYNLPATRMVYEESSSPPLSERTPYSVTLMECELSAISQAGGGSCPASSPLMAYTSVDEVGPVHGTNPVWTANDQVIYRGCHFWNGVEGCGLYATDGATDQPSFPTLLTRDASALPNDSKGNFVTIASQQAGDWEVYALSLNGAWLMNLSQDRLAQDGPSAISPDGNWVAFVSNRDGTWAVWVSSLTGGLVQKLFDLPGDSTWAPNEQEWDRLRLSWGR